MPESGISAGDGQVGQGLEARGPRLTARAGTLQAGTVSLAASQAGGAPESARCCPFLMVDF
jgi:hypothetical protein